MKFNEKYLVPAGEKLTDVLQESLKKMTPEELLCISFDFDIPLDELLDIYDNTQDSEKFITEATKFIKPSRKMTAMLSLLIFGRIFNGKTYDQSIDTVNAFKEKLLKEVESGELTED